MKIVEIAVMIDAVAASLGRIIDSPAKEETVEKIVHLRTINLQKTVNLTSLTIVKTINREENREAQEITIIHPNRDLKIPSIPKISQVDQENHIPSHLRKLQ
jgi:wyosine [tRNA(Phe)-imidazoG37] synthetase (radical SAM superfamily)